MLNSILELFSQSSPVTVMFRGILESVLSDDLLDQLFESHSQRQYVRELTFSQCSELMAEVVTKIRPSINAAYTAKAKAKAKSIPVSVTSVYNKLNNTEPAVSEALVRVTSRKMAAVIDELGGSVPGPIPGYDVRIVDGNHLAGTERRLKVLRNHGAAALPGHTLVILDPQRNLVEDVVVCEDAHANQRILLPELLERVQRRQCWIMDSHFCTLGMLFGMDDRKAFFVVRQHGSLEGQLVGRRKFIGKTDTGRLYEQALLIQMNGRTLKVRRITVVRDQPTESGDTEIHILSNLPEKVSAKTIAEAYRTRWTIETAFQDVTVNLRCEINTLGYPRAALLGFCIALVLYNVLSISKAAICAGTPGAKQLTRNLSTYALVDEVAGTWRGMMIAIPASAWRETFASLTPIQLAKKLRQLAKHVNLKSVTTYKWTPKSPKKKKTSGKRGNHRATHRLLEAQKAKE